VRPYLARFNRTELFILMTVGLSVVAGSVFVLYATVLEPVLPGIQRAEVAVQSRRARLHFQRRAQAFLGTPRVARVDVAHAAIGEERCRAHITTCREAVEEFQCGGVSLLLVQVLREIRERLERFGRGAMRDAEARFRFGQPAGVLERKREIVQQSGVRRGFFERVLEVRDRLVESPREARRVASVEKRRRIRICIRARRRCTMTVLVSLAAAAGAGRVARWRRCGHARLARRLARREARAL